MAILSERKGALIWLNSKSNIDAEFILNLFEFETNIFFNKVYYKPNNSNKFNKLISWYNIQDEQVLNELYIKSNEIDLKKKENKINKYLSSDLYKFILENLHIERNILYKQVKKLHGYKTFNNVYNLAINNNSHSMPK